MASVYILAAPTAFPWSISFFVNIHTPSVPQRNTFGLILHVDTSMQNEQDKIRQIPQLTQTRMSRSLFGEPNYL